MTAPMPARIPLRQGPKPGNPVPTRDTPARIARLRRPMTAAGPEASLFHSSRPIADDSDFPRGSFGRFDGPGATQERTTRVAAHADGARNPASPRAARTGGRGRSTARGMRTARRCPGRAPGAGTRARELDEPFKAHDRLPHRTVGHGHRAGLPGHDDGREPGITRREPISGPIRAAPVVPILIPVALLLVFGAPARRPARRQARLRGLEA